MKKDIVLSVVGARPHFVKAAPFMQAMKGSDIEVRTIHTGQHYDRNMSDVFFNDLGLPTPDINLGIGSGTHAEQTAAVMTGIEPLLFEIKPSAVVVYGDTNSTLGAALAAAKYYFPVVHVEAGVRCGNRRMPEEINRGIIDQISYFLACPSSLAVENLRREGVVDGVHNVGDVMYDTFLLACDAALKSDFDLDKYSVKAGHYMIATLHREETTASSETLRVLLDTMGELGCKVLLPMHPRTRACLEAAGIPLERSDGLQILEPVGYLEMVYLLSHAKLVLTDSGGVQKEAFWAGVPCVTLMRETTWPETIQAGWNVLAGLDPAMIRRSVEEFSNKSEAASENRPEAYGPPGAARRMVEALGWV
jgi:UDP-N-acetylglucosamine 2-epimerase